MKRPQRGFLTTALLMPILVMAVMQPVVALRMEQLAHLKRLDAQVAAMLKGTPVQAAGHAAEVLLDAQTEVYSSFKF